MNRPLPPSLLALLCLLAAPLAWAQTQPGWISSDGKSAPGDPIVLRVVATSPEFTELELSLPGVFDEAVAYAKRSFRRLSLPPTQLVSGIGFPDRNNPRGWWEFPPALRLAPKPPARYLQPSLGSLQKAFFPSSALGQSPRTAEEMRQLGINPEGAQPSVPRLRSTLAVSRQNSPRDLVLESKILEFRDVKLSAPIVPAGFEGSDEADGFVPPELVDESFYAQFEGTYIGSEPELGSLSSLGAFAGVSLALAPYHILTPTLVRLPSKISLVIKHRNGTEDYDCPVPWDAWASLPPFLNGQAILDSLTKKGLPIEASRSAHYLILTPQSWYSILQPLAAWKAIKGLNVDFAFVGSSPADDLPNSRSAIDAFIENYFQKHYCHGVYVLICGDVDVVEAGRSSLITGSPDGSLADSDHVYEVIGANTSPSLYVGRLSANSDADLQAQVDKILRYERTPPPGDWPTRATLCANSQNDAGSYGVNPDWPSKYAKAVQDAVNYGGYTAPPTFQTLHAGALSAATTRATNADVAAALNDGRGLLLYRGHGDENSWTSGWDGSGTAESSGLPWTRTSHVNALANTVHPIVFAINCLNSRLNRADCIAEAWMQRPNSGAVAHFGATVTSYTSENHQRTKGIFRALYESGFSRLGPALAEAERISFSTSGGGDSWNSNTFAYLLLGDPEMTVRKKTVPQWKIVAEIAAFAKVEPYLKGVRLTVLDSADKPDPAGFVRLVDTQGGLHNGFADIEGNVTFPSLLKSQIARADILGDGLAYGVLFLQAPALHPEGMTQAGFRVRLLDMPTARFQIYGSSDLMQWTPLGLSQPDGDDQVFTDPGVRGVPSKFYRAVQVTR